jgi:ComEC/Rec2-related protein
MEKFLGKDPVLRILTAIACGPLVATVPVSGPVFYFFALVAAAILAAMLILRDRTAALVSLMAVLMFIQAGRAATPLTHAPTGPGVVDGVVTDVDRDASGRARYLVSSGSMRYRVTAPPFPSLKPGDRARWSGTVSQPDQWNKGVNGVMSDARLVQSEDGFSWSRIAFSARSAMSQALAHALPEPHAGLLSGIVLGTRSALPKDIQDDFRTAGLSHIIVLSGFNLSIAALAASALFRSKKMRALAGLISAWSLACIAGLSASVARAAIMVTAASYASVLRRTSPPGRPLLLAAAVMLAIEPRAIADPGFQLSFLATIGVLGIAPWIHEKATFVSERWGLREVLAASLGAYVSVMPRIVVLSESLQPYALIANLVVVPFIPWVMYAGALISTIGAVSSIGIGLGVFVYPVLEWVIRVGETVARLPGAQARVSNPYLASAVSLIFLIILIKKTGAVERLFFRSVNQEKRAATDSQFTAAR